MRPRAGTGKRIYGRRGEQGIALVLALLSMITLLLAAAAGLLVGSADVSAMRSSRVMRSMTVRVTFWLCE